MQDFKNHFKNRRNQNDILAVLPDMENNFKVLDYDNYEYTEKKTTKLHFKLHICEGRAAKKRGNFTKIPIDCKST